MISQAFHIGPSTQGGTGYPCLTVHPPAAAPGREGISMETLLGVQSNLLRFCWAAAQVPLFCSGHSWYKFRRNASLSRAAWLKEAMTF